MRNSVTCVSAVAAVALPLTRVSAAGASSNRALCQALSAGSANPWVLAYHVPEVSSNAIRIDRGAVPKFFRFIVTAVTPAEVKLPVQRWFVLNVTKWLPAPPPPVALTRRNASPVPAGPPVDTSTGSVAEPPLVQPDTWPAWKSLTWFSVGVAAAADATASIAAAQ